MCARSPHALHGRTHSHNKERRVIRPALCNQNILCECVRQFRGGRVHVQATLIRLYGVSILYGMVTEIKLHTTHTLFAQNTFSRLLLLKQGLSLSNNNPLI